MTTVKKEKLQIRMIRMISQLKGETKFPKNIREKKRKMKAL